MGLVHCSASQAGHCTDWCSVIKTSQRDGSDLCTPVHLCLSLSLSLSERPQPPLQLSVPQDQVQSRQLKLDWVPGGDGSSPVRYFTLQLRQLPDGNWITHSSSISHNSTSYVVDRWDFLSPSFFLSLSLSLFSPPLVHTDLCILQRSSSNSIEGSFIALNFINISFMFLSQCSALPGWQCAVRVIRLECY